MAGQVLKEFTDRLYLQAINYPYQVFNANMAERLVWSCYIPQS